MTERFTIPIGPQHPALKEPAHFAFTVEGETVTSASVRLGYAHRGIEKAAETRTFIQDLYLMERVCGICSHIHASTFARAVEELAGVTVPPRARMIRTLVAELERIHSHLLWLGVAAHDAGFEALFMYSWRDRETIMAVLESLTGNRVNYSVNVLGGVKCDITPQLDTQIREAVDYLQERTEHYLHVVNTDRVFLKRTKGIGVMSTEQAIRWGVVGPLARASGVPRDIRVEAPYDAYADFPIDIVLDDAGDLAARFTVRLRELFETYRLIRALLDNLPEGDLTTRFPLRIKQAAEVIVRSEAPRGELFYLVRTEGGSSPARVKVRT
ncbi:MAG: nickel-dependent hydrogenase large subunit, partial [Anaerolineae bacterium]